MTLVVAVRRRYPVLSPLYFLVADRADSASVVIELAKDVQAGATSDARDDSPLHVLFLPILLFNLVIKHPDVSTAEAHKEYHNDRLYKEGYHDVAIGENYVQVHRA